ncbi:hypothetical protein PR003_g18077 [Phytophthora rubi]|uniref:Uncharacterized protein n=1 Tax=Phytophthora rubi TaxID=129364 RepID=A0A6A4EAN3_9STRA|nr:hypothetical protein PR003_g18077 [Phytophthora rubi]
MTHRRLRRAPNFRCGGKTSLLADREASRCTPDCMARRERASARFGVPISIGRSC